MSKAALASPADAPPRLALRRAADELLNCVALAVERGEPEDALFGAFARDRLIRLVLHHRAEDVAALLAPGSGWVELLSSQPLVRALFTLPAVPAELALLLEGLESDDVRSMVASVLAKPPHELEQLDRWLADARFTPLLLTYAAWQPKCFVTETERVRYYNYAVRFCDLCADILAHEVAPSLQRLVITVVDTLSSGVIYSCDGALRPFAEAKGRLLTRFVQHRFPEIVATDAKPRPLPGDRPIRLGLLWNDADRRTENMVGVASARHVRTHGFHVTSVIHHHGYHGDVFGQSTLLNDIEELSDDIVDLDRLPKLADKCAAIRALDLDCLLFMNNVTFGYNEYVALATLRLARWQAVNFCAVFTTGFPTIDLYISGALSERGADPDVNYTERLVRLPGTCLIFDREMPHRHRRSRRLAAAVRDPETQTLFVSGANLYKIHPRLSDTWAHILEATPGARLVLYPFNPNWDLSYPAGKFVARFTDQLLTRNVDPERVTVAGPWSDASAVEEILTAADIYLDSFPHSGGLSSLDALRLGVPVVTLCGDTQRENQSADLLDMLGLSRFVARTSGDYVDLAARLAADPELWADYRLEIGRAMQHAAFFDTDDYSNKFAGGLRRALVSE